ncbi:MAG: glycosyltransferase family 2 protein, partial [Nitrospinaceae bacterium]
PQARYGNKLATFLIYIFFGYRFTDLGPFRAIRFDSLKQINMVDTDFGWTVEMQIKAIKNNLRIEEIPVHYRKRIGISKITGTISGTFKAGVKIMYTIFKYLLV